jgi:hypothetical protein
LVERAIPLELTGVTIQETGRSEPRLSRGQGSLSGRPTFANNLATVRAMAAVTKGRIAIKASGGVHTGADALEMLTAGATMIDILTAFVFRGWNTAAKLKRNCWLDGPAWHRSCGRSAPGSAADPAGGGNLPPMTNGKDEMPNAASRTSHQNVSKTYASPRGDVLALTERRSRHPAASSSACWGCVAAAGSGGDAHCQPPVSTS